MSSSYWKTGLLNYVRNPNHESVIFKNSRFLIIKDCYPKASKHFLVLPRTTSINSIEELTEKDIELLESMLKLAREEIVGKELNYQFRLGFHAVPSMDLLHLHVISQDFCSPALKNKKHYLSFTTSFFRDASDVVEELGQNGKIEVDHEKSEALLKGSLICHHCKAVFSNIPKLKAHLEIAFKNRKL